MEADSSIPRPTSPSQPAMSAPGIYAPILDADDANLPSIWDWGELLDFTAAVDDATGDLSIDWDSAPAPAETPPPHPDGSDPGRVRKRDPRMVCSNFLAGRVPCACPEMDEQLMEMEEEEERAGHGKKKPRTTPRASTAGSAGARCQVPTCGADIRELKGYHRRHRVCLRCANAADVVIAGESKRYCQQCGKFHVLLDFDEGKRSCRRKLERHNNRRRRKPVDSKVEIEKESQGDVQSEDISGDGETGKDCSQLSSHMVQKETWVESEGGHVSPVSTAPDSKDGNSDGLLSLDSGETQGDRGKHNSKHGSSPSYYENKSVYSSVCPTGRISFKLYDWNPAEFPRRLRHQIFQWLSNMPVELEGYIRPGCIILTVFVAMPRFMWLKLSEDPISYVHDFVVTPGGMLSGRGNILVYLNNMVFHVVKGGTSVIKANIDVRAPRLHYVHPTCFEAGKPMEFVACGSNLLQPKLRFLVSFSGKYLEHDCSPVSSPFRTEASNASHQLCRIHVPRTEADHYGPVFIEVENEAGLSNFIPVLIGDKETCSEMKVIQQRLVESRFTDSGCFSSTASPSYLCEAYSRRETTFSDFILDIAWLLKKPGSESFQQVVTASQVQRLNSLLNLLISVESTTILERIVTNLRTMMDNVKLTDACNSISDADLRLLNKYVDYAHQLRCRKLQNNGVVDLHSRSLVLKDEQSLSSGEACSVVSFPSQDTEITVNGKFGAVASLTHNKRTETMPLLNKEVSSKANPSKEWPNNASCRASSAEVLTSRYQPFFRFRPTMFLIVTAAVCLCICSVLFHPHKVSEFAITIRRCLLDKFQH